MDASATTEILRAAIETALRRRDPRATVQRSPTESDRSLWIARWPRSEITTRGDDGYFGLDGLRALAVACGLRDDGSDPAEEVERLTMALDRAHHAVREHATRCSHPECDALAPLRCDDCGRRFCDEHDDGLAGHDPGFGPQAHAVGPDDLMAGAAMRAAEASR